MKKEKKNANRVLAKEIRMTISTDETEKYEIKIVPIERI